MDLYSKPTLTLLWISLTSCLGYDSVYPAGDVDESKRAQITIRVYLLNGDDVQTIKLPKAGGLYRPFFSHSGEYFVVPQEVGSFLNAIQKYHNSNEILLIGEYLEILSRNKNQSISPIT